MNEKLAQVIDELLHWRNIQDNTKDPDELAQAQKMVKFYQRKIEELERSLADE